jgi:hypothetical protein
MINTLIQKPKVHTSLDISRNIIIMSSHTINEDPPTWRRHKHEYTLHSKIRPDSSSRKASHFRASSQNYSHHLSKEHAKKTHTYTLDKAGKIRHPGGFGDSGVSGLFWLSRRRLSPGASSESVACNLSEMLPAACACGAGGSSPLPTRGICPHLSLPNVSNASGFYTLKLAKMWGSCEGVVLAITLLYKHGNRLTLRPNHI